MSTEQSVMLYDVSTSELDPLIDFQQKQDINLMLF